MLSSFVMTQDAETRQRAILDELAVIASAGQPWPSAVALAKRLDWPRSTVGYHARELASLGLVALGVGRWATISLTPAGRIAAR